jgi:hypothetical protein
VLAGWLDGCISNQALSANNLTCNRWLLSRTSEVCAGRYSAYRAAQTSLGAVKNAMLPKIALLVGALITRAAELQMSSTADAGLPKFAVIVLKLCPCSRQTSAMGVAHLVLLCTATNNCQPHPELLCQTSVPSTSGCSELLLHIRANVRNAPPVALGLLTAHISPSCNCVGPTNACTECV